MSDNTKKQRILDKYNGECMICQATGEMRIHNRADGKLKDADESDLYPLCPDCYQIVHSPWMVK